MSIEQAAISAINHAAEFASMLTTNGVALRFGPDDMTGAQFHDLRIGQSVWFNRDPDGQHLRVTTRHPVERLEFIADDENGFVSLDYTDER